ncbi:GntR family transcriptional regulator [Agromyces silvae]|uniref:GntR family transcriptional regulator n=1 Tax=Agromyces silvae TaxID=3388266 RepID=UPI00280BF37F|nr:GntR family transcriptional regulator [Agromyces protaetiae]
MPTEVEPAQARWSALPIARVAAPLREQVIAALRAAILESELKPGQRLVERELIERLGVSRTTVREAIRELASEGLVTVVPQKGARVSSPSYEDAADLYEVRAALESLVVRRFVERADDAQVAELYGTVDDYDRIARETGDIRAALRAKDEFYAVLVKGAASPPLQQLLEAIQARVRVLRVTSMSHPGRLRAITVEMRDIVDAIAARNADRAARLCGEHIAMAARTALSELRRTDEASTPSGSPIELD